MSVRRSEWNSWGLRRPPWPRKIYTLHTFTESLDKGQISHLKGTNLWRSFLETEDRDISRTGSLPLKSNAARSLLPRLLVLRLGRGLKPRTTVPEEWSLHTLLSPNIALPEILPCLEDLAHWRAMPPRIQGDYLTQTSRHQNKSLKKKILRAMFAHPRLDGQ